MASIFCQCLLGIQCRDFTMIAADQITSTAVIVMKDDQNKLIELSSHQLMAIIGDLGDTSQISQFISKNLQLYRIRNRYQLSTDATVHFIRKNIAESLRGGIKHINPSGLEVFNRLKKKGDYQFDIYYISTPPRNKPTPSIVNMLLGGYDEESGAQLYSLDFMASSIKVPYGAHGFGGIVSTSIIDRYYRSSLSEEQAYEIIKLCVEEIHQRLFINLPNFQVKVVNKHGIKSLPVITPATFILDKASHREVL